MHCCQCGAIQLGLGGMTLSRFPGIGCKGVGTMHYFARGSSRLDGGSHGTRAVPPGFRSSRRPPAGPRDCRHVGREHAVCGRPHVDVERPSGCCEPAGKRSGRDPHRRRRATPSQSRDAHEHKHSDRLHEHSRRFAQRARAQFADGRVALPERWPDDRWHRGHDQRDRLHNSHGRDAWLKKEFAGTKKYQESGSPWDSIARAVGHFVAGHYVTIVNFGAAAACVASGAVLCGVAIAVATGVSLIHHAVQGTFTRSQWIETIAMGVVGEGIDSATGILEAVGAASDISDTGLYNALRAGVRALGSSPDLLYSLETGNGC